MNIGPNLRTKKYPKSFRPKWSFVKLIPGPLLSAGATGDGTRAPGSELAPEAALGFVIHYIFRAR
jgi:hypothetical protein